MEVTIWMELPEAEKSTKLSTSHNYLWQPKQMVYLLVSKQHGIKVIKLQVPNNWTTS